MYLALLSPRFHALSTNVFYKNTSKALAYVPHVPVSYTNTCLGFGWWLLSLKLSGFKNVF